MDLDGQSDRGLAEIRAFISCDSPSAASMIAARITQAVARPVEHPRWVARAASPALVSW